MLLDGEELALIDVREERIFSESHLLFARCVPLEPAGAAHRARWCRAARPASCWSTTTTVWPSAPPRCSLRAGYTDLRMLDGGIAGWAAAGFELFSGVNVPSKAFGEFVEHESGTPSISAEELNALMRSRHRHGGARQSRPFDEFYRVSIPTGVNVPGAELVLRVHDMAPSPDTLVVVNCAGRTRCIIGAQSLINAGVPNKVVALRNGTMGWNLAGLTPRQRQDRSARRRSRTARSPGRNPPPKRSRASSASASIDRGGAWRAARRDESARSTCSTCAIRPNTRAGHVRGRAVGAGRAARAGDRPVCRHAATRASCWSTTGRCAPS